MNTPNSDNEYTKEEPKEINTKKSDSLDKRNPLTVHNVKGLGTKPATLTMKPLPTYFAKNDSNRIKMRPYPQVL